MAATEQPVQTMPAPSPFQIVDWIVAAFLGSYVELLAEILRKFGHDMRSAMVHWDITAVFMVALMTTLIIVPIYLISKASEKLADRRAERVIFIISVFGSAFFMPPLEWFAKLASGH